MKLNQLTIEHAHQGLAKKEFSSVELTQACLDSIKSVDGKIHAFLEVIEDLALEQAKEADKKIANSKCDILTGIPISVKDIILIDGIKATGGSKILENYSATYDATVIEKLKELGAVFLGKVNLDEFAMGSSTENSAFERTRNPWDLERVPGGSSGGSAAAVAADMCLASLGSDTAGSVRQPASFCGVVGLKPTYGRVSRFGLMAMTSSLDQIGPLTKSVKDAAFLFKGIEGHDKNDSTTYKKQDIIVGNIEKQIKGMKIGVPKEYFIKGMDSEVQKKVEDAIEKLKELGAEIINISLPLTKYALAVYYITATSEISANLARYDGIRYGHSVASGQKPVASNLMEVYAKSKAGGFGSEAKRRIILGTFSLSAGYYDQYYIKAQKVRALIRKEFEQAFKKVDCLVAPTAPTVAFKLGEKFEDPLTMYLSDIYTVPANIGGICSVSFPCGFSKGLPVGLQIMAKPFAEETILGVAYNYEQATDKKKKKPLMR